MNFEKVWALGRLPEFREWKRMHPSKPAYAFLQGKYKEVLKKNTRKRRFRRYWGMGARTDIPGACQFTSNSTTELLP